MLFKKRHYRLVPAGAQIFRRAAKAFARWTGRGGRAVTRPLNRAGNRIVIESACWYVKVKGPGGAWIERKAFRDRVASEHLHAELIVRAERRQAGVTDALDDELGRPIAEHLAAWRRHLENRNTTTDHVQRAVERCRHVIEGTGAATLADVVPGRIVQYLADKRRAGLTPSTSNHYLTALKMFTRWCVRDRRAGLDPLAGLARLKVADHELKRRRRALSTAELAELIQATRQNPKAFRGLSGASRAVLYTVAAATGLRAAELATLTVRSFELAAAGGIVRCLKTKNGTEAVIPLAAGLATMLREFLAGRPPDGLCWPGTWAGSSHRASAEMIRADLDYARTRWIADAADEGEAAARDQSTFLRYQDPGGRYADFHALRHTFITALMDSGVHPKRVMELARHSTLSLTLRYAGPTLLGELAAEIERLPDVWNLAGASRKGARKGAPPMTQDDAGCRAVS